MKFCSSGSSSAEAAINAASANNLICKGKRGISAVMAKKLARTLGTDDKLWINLQSAFDLTMAEEPDFGRIRA